jgi:hypothetical protein
MSWGSTFGSLIIFGDFGGRGESNPVSFPDVLVIYRESDVWHASCASRRIAELFVAHLDQMITYQIPTGYTHGCRREAVSYYGKSSKIDASSNAARTVMRCYSCLVERGRSEWNLRKGTRNGPSRNRSAAPGAFAHPSKRTNQLIDAVTGSKTAFLRRGWSGSHTNSTDVNVRGLGQVR